MIRHYMKAIAIALALVTAQQAYALSLTPEQQRQLEALPDSQRQQLMEQYRQATSSSAGSETQQAEDQGKQNERGKQPGVIPLAEAQAQSSGQSRETGGGAPDEQTVSGVQEGEKTSGEDEKTAEDILREEYKEWRQASSLSGDDLLPFGYEMFAGQPTSFVASGDAPVPVGYRVGPGDEVRILLTGRENQDLTLTIDRSGTIQLPKIGPVSVHGKTLEELRSYIQGIVKEKFIGVESFVSLGELRSISVFLTGESRNPGVYSVSAFSTISQALSVSGGIELSGSLRNIQLIRDGKVVSQFDLYDLMLAGDRSADTQLKSGDVIFVPAIEDRIAVTGAVVRPGVYELEGPNSLQDILKLAGGLRAEADPGKIQVSRLRPDSKRTLIDLELKNAGDFNILQGDTIRIGKIHDRLRGAVEIRGSSPITGQYEWRQGMRLSRFLNNRNDHLDDDTDLNFGLIASRTGENYDVTLRRFSPKDVLANPGSQADPILKERDSILLFEEGESRLGLLEPIIGSFREDLGAEELPPLVSIDGAVRYPGTYPLLEDHTINDMIHFAGGLARDGQSLISADLEFGLLIRRQGDFGRQINPIPYRPVSALNQPHSEDNLSLQELDRILVFNRNDSRSDLLQPVIEELREDLLPGQLAPIISITGAVKYPGSYPLLPGTSVKKLIGYAGGLTNASYALEAELIRQSLTQQRAESELIKLSLKTPKDQSLELAPTDRIHIKRLPDLNLQQTVTLQGEVNFPGSYTIRRGETLSQVVERAGGLTDYAYAKGAVFTRERLREQEQKRLDEAQRRLRRDISTSRTDAPGEESTIEGDEETVVRVLEDIGEAQAVGRLVIDLPELLAGETSRDVRLQDGDTLTIPEISQAVTVMGEVQFATSHLHDPGLSIRDYINRSGGLAFQADESRIYVIKADGSVTVPDQSRWFGSADPVEPGDTVVVPLNLSQLSSMELAKDVSQIIYQVALGAAAVQGLKD